MAKKYVISDMDGVIYRGKTLIDGAAEFVGRMLAGQTPFLFLTNNSEQTPIDLKRKLETLGISGLSEANLILAAWRSDQERVMHGAVSETAARRSTAKSRGVCAVAVSAAVAKAHAVPSRILNRSEGARVNIEYSCLVRMATSSLY